MEQDAKRPRFHQKEYKQQNANVQLDFTFRDFQNLFTYDPFGEDIMKVLNREC